MSPSESLAPRTRDSLDTIQDFLRTLVARFRGDEVLTAARQFPARDAKFRPMPAWVTSALAEAYRAKGIEQLYLHQASTAELVRDGRNVVVVTPTASGKTLCYNLPVLSAVLEDPDTRALLLFPTKALAQDQLAELQDLSKRLNDSFGVFTYDGDTPSDARKAIRERGRDLIRCRERLGGRTQPSAPAAPDHCYSEPITQTAAQARVLGRLCGHWTTNRAIR
jgi:DEAD/DEAH box helicase domain-containing protein